MIEDFEARKTGCGLEKDEPTPHENFTWFNPSLHQGKGRIEAAEMVEAFRLWTTGEGPTFLTVFAGPGIGKTDLAKTAVWMLTPTWKERHSYYITAHEFDKRVKDFSSSKQNSSNGYYVDPDEWVDRLAKNVENLVLDDIGAGYIDRGWTASRLEKLIDLRYRLQRRTVVITNLSRDALYQEVGGRVYSRITDAAMSVVLEPEFMIDVRQLENDERKRAAK